MTTPPVRPTKTVSRSSRKKTKSSKKHITSSTAAQIRDANTKEYRQIAKQNSVPLTTAKRWRRLKGSEPTPVQRRAITDAFIIDALYNCLNVRQKDCKKKFVSISDVKKEYTNITTLKVPGDKIFYDLMKQIKDLQPRGKLRRLCIYRENRELTAEEFEYFEKYSKRHWY